MKSGVSFGENFVESDWISRCSSDLVIEVVYHLSLLDLDQLNHVVTYLIGTVIADADVAVAAQMMLQFYLLVFQGQYTIEGLSLKY